MLPICAVLTPCHPPMSMQPLPSTTAVMAEATRSQNVLRLRAATRNSRRTMGKTLINSCFYHHRLDECERCRDPAAGLLALATHHLNSFSIWSATYWWPVSVQ